MFLTTFHAMEDHASNFFSYICQYLVKQFPVYPEIKRRDTANIPSFILSFSYKNIIPFYFKFSITRHFQHGHNL